MGLCNNADIFQERMSELLASGLKPYESTSTTSCVTKGSFEKHLKGLKEVFTRLRQARLKINANKLDYHITRAGITPIAKKAQGSQSIPAPNIGIINFYHNMWKDRAELLAALTALTSTNVPFK